MNALPQTAATPRAAYPMRTKHPKGAKAMPMPSANKKEMHDDHDNRVAAYCGEWVSSPEEADRRIVKDCYELSERQSLNTSKN